MPCVTAAEVARVLGRRVEPKDTGASTPPAPRVPALPPLNVRVEDRQRPFGVYMPLPRMCGAETLQGVEEIAVGDLGRLFCAELDTVVGRLRNVLGELRRRGSTTDSVTNSVVTFINTYGRTLASPLFGESCQNAVDEGERLVVAGNEQIKKLSGTPVPTTDVTISKEGGPAEVLKSFRSIIVATAVTVGAGALIYLAGPALRAVSSRVADRLNRSRKSGPVSGLGRAARKRRRRKAER